MKDLIQKIRDSIEAGIILEHMALIDELEERCDKLESLETDCEFVEAKDRA